MRHPLDRLRLPSLVLAVGLHLSPVVRAVLPCVQTASNLLAIVFRWTAGTAAALGNIQAVSGGSTVITNPKTANATEGEPFSLRLTTAPEQAHYWSANGLPIGINLEGVVGQTFWRLNGTPTAHGTFNVLLTAKDEPTSNAERTTTATLVLTIAPGVAVAVPPTITGQPAGQIVTEGDNVAFTITAEGSPPLVYEWRLNGTPVPGGTSATLTLNDVTLDQAGSYDVVVSNAATSVTSEPATLSIHPNPTPPPLLEQIHIAAGQLTANFTPQIGKIYALEQSTDVAAGWSEIRTFGPTTDQIPLAIEVPIGTRRVAFFRLKSH